jgi:uncharacterized protein (TIGR02996 family)
MTEADFLKAIATAPEDVGPRLAFADWLEERGDARAEAVRARCRYRLPITPQEVRSLAAIAAARSRATATQVCLAVVPANPGHVFADVPTRAAFAGDLRHLSLLDVARHFPRDDKGRLQLDCTVLLAGYACAGELPRYRDLWLVAAGPARRSDPQTITVKLDLVIAENHGHNWSRVRWWWDRRHTGTSEEARWGITGVELRGVTGPQGGRQFAALEARRKNGTLTQRERILLCTALQDAGRFEEALQVCVVEYVTDITRILNTDRFSFSRGRVDPSKKMIAARAQKLRRALWEMAPWRLEQALAAEQARLDDWRTGRPGRAHKTPQPRLFIMPGSRAARKPGLTLVSGSEGRPQLVIRFTAANVVLPESDWKRPVELDIARWCGG